MTLWGENNPQANPEAVVTSGKARFTVLTPEMIRIEYSDKGFFEDRATFTVVNRNLAVPHYSKSEDATFIYIETDKLKLKYRKGTNPRTLPPSSSNLSITLNHNGREVLWYPGKPDPLNLKGTCRTLDGSNGQNKRSEMEDGLISRSGWAVIEDSWTSSRSDGSRSFAFEPETELGYDWWAERKDPHALDIYFLGYGSNYKKALSDYTQIAGKIPLPPSYVFGYWYSKYSSYSADDYREIMNDLSSNNIPTDVMILDMDWHWNGSEGSMSGGRGGWTGWSWNTNLIPDPKGLLKEMHDRNFKVALNLHPADGVSSQESPEFFTAMNEFLRGKYDVNGSGGKVIPWYLDYPDFTDSFFSTIIREHEGEGVDFWWLDWQ
ncbi:MAG TPA: glycosyl hydrolase family 31, partial [Porphyromonadaceae bacterium]|nr:glycosyl hydrolase family 31 [Porphyromonadaceae bacterium]